MSFTINAPESSRLDRLLPAGAALVTVTLWASAFVVIRYADRELAPGALALGRLLVGSLALGIAVLARRGAAGRGCRRSDPLAVARSAPPARALAGIVVCGVLWFGLYNLALNEAEARVDAGTSAMLVNVGPILIAVLAGWILREGFPHRLLLGCLVSFAGAALIGVATSSHGIGQVWGALLCIAAAAAYAGGVVAQKPALRHASALYVTWLACTIGAFSSLVYAGSLVRGLGHAHAGALWST
ncbi:MAG: DMT family transporter, partial [Solirubrobacterales bacterium]|nr:DMT family transporter [Solirubrobacterales bacterium]